MGTRHNSQGKCCCAAARELARRAFVPVGAACAGSAWRAPPHDPAESDPEFSDKVAGWANANGIQFIDLVEPCERATDQGVSCFFEEDIHFRASGHHVVADSIRAYFPELFGEPTENQPGM